MNIHMKTAPQMTLTVLEQELLVQLVSVAYYIPLDTV